jgi:hypothetical protein
LRDSKRRRLRRKKRLDKRSEISYTRSSKKLRLRLVNPKKPTKKRSRLRKQRRLNREKP